MKTLDAMFKLHDGYTKTITKMFKKTDEMGKKVVSTSGQVDKMDKVISKVGMNTGGIDKATKSIGKLLSVTALAVGAIKGMGIADEFVNTRARLDIMNDGLQTTAELQDKIMNSANRSRGSYTDMASSIAKMGILAGENFNSNDELIGFTELVQKSFKIGGAGTQEQQSGMYQLTQAMAAGKLQGDEFRSIMENAPMIAEAIAKYTGKSKGDLKEMSSDGVITADIIKGAMFSMADDINGKFESMPKTFGDIWNVIKNGAIDAFDPIITKINELINTDGFDTFVSSIVWGFNVIAIGLSGVINGFIWFGNVVQENWNIIWPILAGIAMVAIPMLIAGLWATIPPLLTMAATLALANLPMLVVIGSIAMIIISLQMMGITFENVFGFIGGVIGVFVAGFYNYFVYMWNAVAAFINFFGNVFTNPILAVKKLFYDLSVDVLGFIEKMAKGIEKLVNSIPGVEVNITSGISNLKNDLAAKSKDISDEAGLKEWAKTLDFVEYSDAYSKGKGIGTNTYGDITESLSGMIGGIGKIPTGGELDFNNFMVDGAMPITEPKGKKLNVSIDKEDIKYIKDLAERDYIANFSTATLAPQVSIQFGDVHETADANKVGKIIEKILWEEIAVIAEG